MNQSPIGYQEGIYELLRAKADPNLEVQKMTPIMWAARSNQFESIKVLMKYGGDLNIATESGNAMH